MNTLQLLNTNRIYGKIATKQPQYYYVGRLTFNNTPLPNGENNRSVFTETIKEAEQLLLDYAEKHCLAGEVVIKNIRFDEVVRTVQCNFTKF